MASLAALNTPNGAVGDTFSGKAIVRVLDAAKGKYIWGNSTDGLVPTADNQALKDSIPTPIPLQVFSGSGATLATGVTGTLLCNEGRVHTVARTTGSDPILTWELVFSVPLAFLTAPVKLRWAVPSTKSGAGAVRIDSGVQINLSGNSTGWNSDTPAQVTVRTDAGWSWFEMSFPARADAATQVKLNLPPTQIQLPCIYADNAVVALSGTVTGMKLTDKRTGDTVNFKPTDFATKVEVPAIKSILVTWGQTIATVLRQCRRTVAIVL
jgi:hypothetical protein